jgi:GMP synthase-like glutamine amidotransferase
MNILVFQHLDVEHPGIFREFWAEDGHTWQAVELDTGSVIPSLDGFDLLVVMGGPMDVWQEDLYPWLKAEKRAIREWVAERAKPYLGICLGHQLLAAAIGGEVTPMTTPEVGLSPVILTYAGALDPLFASFGPTLETFQWHGAQVSKLPSDSVILAENEHSAVQAFRWGPHAYGLQYHVEITESTVADWQAIPTYAASLKQALGAERARELADVVAARLPAFRRNARRLYENLRSTLKPQR